MSIHDAYMQILEISKEATEKHPGDGQMEPDAELQSDDQIKSGKISLQVITVMKCFRPRYWGNQ